jgi:hypothetical protein
MTFPLNLSSKDRFHVVGVVAFTATHKKIKKKREKEGSTLLNRCRVRMLTALLKLLEMKITKKYIKKEMTYSTCKFWSKIRISPIRKNLPKIRVLWIPSLQISSNQSTSRRTS